MEDLEAKKKELQLKRDIARMELEQSSLQAAKSFWRWITRIGLPGFFGLLAAVSWWAVLFMHNLGDREFVAVFAFLMLGVAVGIRLWASTRSP